MSIEFDNRDCACNWKLWWLTPAGERVQYGDIPRGSTHTQTTFRGHAWLLEHEEDVAAPRTTERQLFYVAAPVPGVVKIGDDAGCQDSAAAGSETE